AHLPKCSHVAALLFSTGKFPQGESRTVRSWAQSLATLKCCLARKGRARGWQMYFRLRYVIAGFEFGDAEIKVSDPVKKINVVISKRPQTDINPPAAADDGLAIATRPTD